MKYRVLRSVLLLGFVCFFSCCDLSKDMKGFLSVRGQHFVDSEGRTVILNGINHVTKIPEKSYLHEDDKELFRQFRDWGFNCVRFGICWDALEPEPGKINEAYLKEIDKRVLWAEENGLWLILDMHQDLYGRKFSNGAPLWATLDDGLPHETGDVWSDAYLVSPAVHKAFDNFWNNTPAPDGIGIQDHYVFVWKTLAKRYANAPAVAGFDIMNEPAMGTEGLAVFDKLLEAYAVVATQKSGKTPTEEELVSLWGNEAARVEALKEMDVKESYRFILDNATDAVSRFEEGTLSDFYQKTRDAIREVNKRQLIFLEHSYFCNTGIKSSFRIPKDKKGNPDQLCAYAPHGYDLVTDTQGAETPGYNRLDVIFENIFKAGKEKQVPVIVGEWGAFYKGGTYLPQARYLTRLFEQQLAGQTFWCYWDDIGEQDFFSVLSRPYPASVSGLLHHYSNDYEANRFTCQWEEEDEEGITRIYVPNIHQMNIDKQVDIQPASEVKLTSRDQSVAGYVEIKSIGKVRKLTITF